MHGNVRLHAADALQQLKLWYLIACLDRLSSKVEIYQEPKPVLPRGHHVRAESVVLTCVEYNQEIWRACSEESALSHP